VGIAVSLVGHLILLAALVEVRPPSKVFTVDRGEPLIVELPKADEQAERGQAAPAPPTPAAKAPPAPKVQPPAPKATPPSPAPRIARAEPPTPKVTEAPAPEPPKASTPAVQEPPTPEGVRPAAAPKPAESQANDPSRTPEPQPRQAEPASPAPQVAAVPPPREPAIDGLSALRRRGPGAPGAGGFGEGRAGIEGEPIALNSTDKRFSDYLIRVKRMIQEKWTYPCIKNSSTRECEYKSAQLVIEFGILRDGRVPYVTVHQPAAWDVYDSVAVNAIKLASPFPPVPASLMEQARPGSTGVPIMAHFHYVLESASIMNFLR
jgi:outer membrane biosynthesis protein TonB